MLSSSVSARSCSTRSAASASSRWRTNCTSRPNTTAPPTVMLRAIISGGNHEGRGGPRPATSPIAPETTNTTTKAMNQRTPACAPVKIRAPSGARMPHSPTAPDATNPPTNAIETVGASRMFHSSTRSSQSTSRVREKTPIAASEISVYSHAMSPAQTPSAR